MKRSILFVLSFLLFSVFLFLMKDDTVVRTGIVQKGKSFIEGLKIVNKKDGKNEWVLTAKRADITDKGDTAYLSDLEILLEEKDMKINAEKGIYNMKDRSLAVNGSIVAHGKGYTIRSDEARYDGRTGHLKTDSPVVIESRKFHLQGSGMQIDSSEGMVKIEKNVKAVFYR